MYYTRFLGYLQELFLRLGVTFRVLQFQPHIFDVSVAFFPPIRYNRYIQYLSRL
jgi:hypothetical protein